MVLRIEKDACRSGRSGRDQNEALNLHEDEEPMTTHLARELLVFDPNPHFDAHGPDGPVSTSSWPRTMRHCVGVRTSSMFGRLSHPFIHCS